MNEPTERSFIGMIAGRKDDLGFLARLRRGLSDDTEDQAWPIIASRMQRDDFLDEGTRKVWLTVCGLAAMLVHKDLLEANGKSIGRILREIYEAKIDVKQKKGKEDADEKLIKSSPARRLVRILNSRDIQESCSLIVDVVKMAVAEGLKVDCYRLYEDLMAWHDADRLEQLRLIWSQDFYRPYAVVGQSSEETTDE